MKVVSKESSKHLVTFKSADCLAALIGKPVSGEDVRRRRYETRLGPLEIEVRYMGNVVKKVDALRFIQSLGIECDEVDLKNGRVSMDISGPEGFFSISNLTTVARSVRIVVPQAEQSEANVPDSTKPDTADGPEVESE